MATSYVLFILLASPTGRDTATACTNYCGPGTRSQFCGGRKPECPEKTLKVRLKLTQTQSTYNIVVEVEGVIDVHYANLTSQGVRHRVFYLDGHPSRYQPLPTGRNRREPVFPFGDSRTTMFMYSHTTMFTYSHANTPLGQSQRELIFAKNFQKY